MTREQQLLKIIEIGDRFQVILENEAFRDTVKSTEQRIKTEWQEAQTTEERESKWYLLQALTMLLTELRMPVTEKYLATRQLQKLTDNDE
ncbi:hypothetical protein [Methylobacter sp. YRD-M1]|uniref:hypothetical protein n=1 Tax=Methylobacter sp. YRD-M1 TaxID=2911520 RepID=UPI00227B489D|nr:hypothetical protein [Methylobacter sp. YRD-M1]WAK01862.1 hypothetical protein LZ558_18915 [Methylobacter sp. YRD-M1]